MDGKHMRRDKPSMGRFALGAVALLAILGCRPPAGQGPPPGPQPAMVAQPPPPPPPPPFPTEARNGQLSLAPGLVPDPFVVTGTTRGRAPATSLGAPCPLMIHGKPEYIVAVQQGFADLAVLAHGSTTVGLMLMDERGGFVCSDDGHPVIRAPFAPGRYAVWVGTAAQGQQANYRLGFSERPETTAESLPASLGGAWDATGDRLTVTAGFEPDPLVVQGTVASPTVDATAFGGDCVGWISPQPNHLMVLAEEMPMLRIMARHNRDSALVITDTRGNVYCDDDGDGRFPVIARPFARGHYRIWVASKRENVGVSYALGATVQEGLAARALPRATGP